MVYNLRVYLTELVRRWVARKIVRQLFVSMVGVMVAAVLVFAASILAGRMLGPEEYGRYALMLAIAQIMVIVILPGIDTALMRYVARSGEDIGEKEAYISSAAVLYITFLVAGVLLFLVIRAISIRIIPAVGGVYGAAMIYALVISQRNFHESIIRGSHKFSLQAGVKVIEAGLVLGVFLFLSWYRDCRSYQCYFAAALVGALVSVVLYWPYTLGAIKWRVSGQYINRLWAYGKFGIIGALAGVLQTSADRLLIVRVLGTHELGLYTAYYASSVMIAVQMGVILSNVLFPVAAGRRDHREMLWQLDKFFLIGVLPAVGVVVMMIYIALLLFGSAYVFDLLLAVFMSFYAVSSVVVAVYVNVIASAGKEAFKISTIHMLIAGCLYLSVLAYILPELGVYAPPVAALFGFAYLVCMRLILLKKSPLFLSPTNM